MKMTRVKLEYNWFNLWWEKWDDCDDTSKVTDSLTHELTQIVDIKWSHSQLFTASSFSKILAKCQWDVMKGTFVSLTLWDRYKWCEIISNSNKWSTTRENIYFFSPVRGKEKVKLYVFTHHSLHNNDTFLMMLLFFDATSILLLLLLSLMLLMWKDEYFFSLWWILLYTWAT